MEGVAMISGMEFAKALDFVPPEGINGGIFCAACDRCEPVQDMFFYRNEWVCASCKEKRRLPVNKSGNK
jgi:hypothetical protein